MATSTLFKALNLDMRSSAIIFGIIFSIKAYAQESFKFINYTTVNGLSDNRVLCITQDSRGFMWFGTSEGLSRFDGNKFENYFADPGSGNTPPDNVITYLDEYKPGHLLLLVGANVCCLNTFTRQFYTPAIGFGKNVHSISKRGKLGYLVNSVDTSFIVNEQLQPIDTLFSPFQRPEQMVVALHLDKNRILAGKINEYYIYNTVEKKYTLLLSEKDMPAREKFLTFHYFDSTDQSLYFSNYFEGIFKYDLSGKLLLNWGLNNKPIPFTNGNVGFIVAKNDSILWIGSAEAQGLAIINKHTNRATLLKADTGNTFSLTANSMLAHYEDTQGNAWLGTIKGINRINTKASSIKKLDLPQSINNPFASIKEGSDGKFYVARFGHPHVWKINKTNDNVEEVNMGPLTPIWCFNNFGHELVITGAGTTITRYNPATKKWKTTDFLKKYFPQSDIVILGFKHSNGDEWYSGNAGGGFVRIRAKDNTIHHYKKDGPAGNFPISYYPYYTEDRNGDVWFGVNKISRLLHWNVKTERFNQVDLSSIPGTKKHLFRGITDVLADNEGNIWIGFDGSGIVRFHPGSNEAVHYTIANGLASNYVSSMALDHKGRLWIGTLKGLTCLIPRENKFITFTSKDGFPDDRFVERCILFDTSTHQLWIGGASELVRFDPDELLKSSTRKIPVYIDAVVVNNQHFIDQNASNTLLAPTQNNIQFSFIGLDAEGGRNIEYSYQLVGADKNWISNNNTVASYNSLSPGDYEFNVRGRYKGDTEWMALQQPFKFTIETPWHQTWWFRIAFSIAVVASSWFLIRNYYRNKFLRHKAMMEKEIAIEQERTKMARELHDGLGSMLSGIKHSFTAMTKEFELNDKQKLLFHSNLDKLNESIKELRNISHNMASDVLLKYGLENSLRDYCNTASLNTGIPVTFTALDTRDLVINQEKSVHIFRIIQELFQNIIKHSDAKNVVVQISNNNKQLYITVEDDGKGFDMVRTKHFDGIGLKNIETRIKLLKGNLDYKTAPGKGTSVLMTIPCSN